MPPNKTTKSWGSSGGGGSSNKKKGTQQLQQIAYYAPVLPVPAWVDVDVKDLPPDVVVEAENWGCCDNCGKWRKLPKGHPPLPDDDTPWYCKMNPDVTRNRCDAPEEAYVDGPVPEVLLPPPPPLPAPKPVKKAAAPKVQKQQPIYKQEPDSYQRGYGAQQSDYGGDDGSGKRKRKTLSMAEYDTTDDWEAQERAYQKASSFKKVKAGVVSPKAGASGPLKVFATPVEELQQLMAGCQRIEANCGTWELTTAAAPHLTATHVDLPAWLWEGLYLFAPTEAAIAAAALETFTAAEYVTPRPPMLAAAPATTDGNASAMLGGAGGMAADSSVGGGGKAAPCAAVIASATAATAGRKPLPEAEAYLRLGLLAVALAVQREVKPLLGLPTEQATAAVMARVAARSPSAAEAGTAVPSQPPISSPSVPITASYTPQNPHSFSQAPHAPQSTGHSYLQQQQQHPFQQQQQQQQPQLHTQQQAQQLYPFSQAPSSTPPQPSPLMQFSSTHLPAAASAPRPTPPTTSTPPSSNALSSANVTAPLLGNASATATLLSALAAAQSPALVEVAAARGINAQQLATLQLAAGGGFNSSLIPQQQASVLLEQLKGAAAAKQAATAATAAAASAAAATSAAAKSGSQSSGVQGLHQVSNGVFSGLLGQVGLLQPGMFSTGPGRTGSAQFQNPTPSLGAGQAQGAGAQPPVATSQYPVVVPPQ